jgi:hypothetical protein
MNSAVKTAQTDADGKYEIPDVPPRNYCLYVLIATKSMSAKWLQPVAVSGDDVKLDLFKDNAERISN